MLKMKFNGQVKEDIDLLKPNKDSSKSKKLCLIVITETSRI